MNINIEAITAQINEGHKLINEALTSLKAQYLVRYDYSENSVHITSEKEFLELFSTYVIKPRNGERYPTLLSATHQGVEFFVLSQEPLPEGTTMICVSKPVPVEEAVLR